MLDATQNTGTYTTTTIAPTFRATWRIVYTTNKKCRKLSEFVEWFANMSCKQELEGFSRTVPLWIRNCF